MNVEFERAVQLAGNERRAHRRVLDRREHGIGRVGLLFVGKVDPCDELLEQAARKDRDVDVRRLRPAARTWHGPRLDGQEFEATLGVRWAAAEAGEALLERQLFP